MSLWRKNIEYARKRWRDGGRQFRRQSQGSAGHLPPPRGTYAPYLTVFSRNHQHSRPIHSQPRLLYQPDQVTSSRSLDFEPPPFLLSCEINVTIRPFDVRHPIQQGRVMKPYYDYGTASHVAGLRSHLRNLIRAYGPTPCFLTRHIVVIDKLE